jgi:L-fuculose-phosphate aldolase
MPSEFEARRDIIEMGRRIWQRGYVAANDGNLSVRVGDRVVVTPTGLSKGFLRPDDLVVVDLKGRKLSGSREATSELTMHLHVYSIRDDVGAVVHAHPPKATGFAVAGVPLAQCVLPEVILTLGDVPLTDYATPSTEEVALAIDDHIRRFSALLLRNHGALTVGKDLEEAYFRMETVEHFAEITLAARALGGESPLSVDEVRKLLNAREALGLSGGPASCTDCGACATAGVEDESETAPAAGPGTPGKAGDRTPSGQEVDEELVVQAVLRRLREATGRS